MSRLTENKIIIITRKTRLDGLIARFNTVDQAQFYVESLGEDFTDYIGEDLLYKNVVRETEATLSTIGRVQMLDRSYMANFVFGAKDTIVIIGQDGLVANSMKYLNGHAVIAINPDPKRWDGALLPFTPVDAKTIIQEVFAGSRTIKEITFAKASLNNGEEMLAVNDLFIGPKTHTSARYKINVGGTQEQHSSSGIIVSTGLGSTGWLRSLLAGAQGIVGAQNVHNSRICDPNQFTWDADFLSYTVREPFPSQITSTELVFGEVNKNEGLVITSMMPQNGVIFSDGMEADFLEFNSGTTATISVAEKRGFLVV
jgi:NAD kinase